MRRYKALIFDLCDTLMPYCEDRMPKVTIRGQQVYTTSSLLFDCFIGSYAHVSYEQFHDHFIAAKETITALCADGQEICASVRFAQFLDRLEIAPSPQREWIHKKLMEIHFDRVARCLSCPDENKALLTSLSKKYPLGLITNFDDTKTIYQVLDREGVRGFFHTLLISAEFGLRKPRKEIFLAACDTLALSPAEILFIGDSLRSDIAGAYGVGMDTVWINRDGEALPEGAPQPNRTLRSVAELPSVLEETHDFSHENTIWREKWERTKTVP